MLSLIICSRTVDISDELKQNIATSIGCEYELCVIDNSRNEYSIFTAYNEGVRRAKGNILCFMHDDILFCTEKWGNIITAQFEDQSIGIIGFAGTHFMPSCPLYWTEIPFISEYSLQNDRNTIVECKCEDYFNGDLADVVTVDGFCMFIRQSLFAKVRFDSSSYSGFHAYDMDICMQVLHAGYRVCVSRSILIEHAWSETEARCRDGYVQALENNMRLFYQKWQTQLPLWCGIDISPTIAVRLNNLCIQAYDARKARQSMSYRLGRFLITPFRKLKVLLNL